MRFLPLLAVLAFFLLACERSPGVAGTPAKVGWGKTLGTAQQVRLARHPQGGVVVLTAQADTLVLRRFDDDGGARWERTVAGNQVHAEAAALAVDGTGVIYVPVRSLAATIAVGPQSVPCPEVAHDCTALVAYQPDGTMAWLSPAQAGFSRGVTGDVDGAVFFTASPTDAIGAGGSTIATAFTPTGEVRWLRSMPEILRNFEPPPHHPTFRAGAGRVAVLGSDWNRGQTNHLCAFARVLNSANGATVATFTTCMEGEANHSTIEDGAVLADRTLVALVRVGPPDQRTRTLLLAIDEGGKERLRMDLPFVARIARHGAGVVLVASMLGPIAYLDEGLTPRWQWPGALANGAVTAHPAGPCAALVAEAPEGGLFLLSRACPGTRALLGATTIATTTGRDFAPADERLLVRMGPELATRLDERCGNGWLDPGEGCDGDQFMTSGEPIFEGDWAPPISCTSMGHGSGSVACTGCQPDYAACSSP